MPRDRAESLSETTERVPPLDGDLRDRSARPFSAAPALDVAQHERYELLFELASGGMGTVYVGRRLGAGGFQRVVAIKRMKPAIVEDPLAVSAFHEEARIASLVQHANVVAIHDVHQQGDELFLVMDYVEGVSLAHLLRQLRKLGKRLARDVGLRIVYDALLGLHAAHELCDHEGRSLELVHRDATPHNVLLGTDGSVRLTDFGIARAVARAGHTDPGCAKGKFAYMAPEHAFAEPLDRRADIFAMGVVAWEVLTGRRLFENRTMREVARGAALGKIPRPSERGAACSPALDDLVLRALAPWRDDRYATAMDFANAIDELASAEGGLPPSSAIADVVELVCGDDVRARTQQLREALRDKAPALDSSSTVRRRSRGGSDAPPARAPRDAHLEARIPTPTAAPARDTTASESSAPSSPNAATPRRRAPWGRFAIIVVGASLWAMAIGVLVGRFAGGSTQVPEAQRIAGPLLLLSTEVRHRALAEPAPTEPPGSPTR